MRRNTALIAGLLLALLAACRTPTAPPTLTEEPLASAKPTGNEAGEEEAAPTEGAESGFPGNPVTSNDQWTPVIQDFDGVEMALVPAGCFMMGSEDGDSDEQPVHEVCFEEPFWIDVTEVTNAQYGSEGAFSGADRPRESVDWYDAVAHCESRGARLPTEAEWEYAARGPDELRYPWGDEFDCRRGNFDDETEYDSYVIEGGENCDGYVETAPAGSFPAGASWVGALDLNGNVWEWVADWYDKGYYGALADGVVNPQGPDSGDGRVLRGGSWRNISSDYLRAAIRNWEYPDTWFNYFGFRCARSF